jgi:hypothetical protein
VYVNVRVVVDPGESENVLVLEIEKSVLVFAHGATPVTFSVAVPGFEIVTVTCWDAPDPMFPKLTGFGEAEICGVVVVVTPVPLTLTLYGVVGAFEANAKQPVSLPVPLGVYVIVRVVLDPAATEKLAVLEIENSLLVFVQRVTPLTFSVAVPGFEIVTVSCRELPVFTLPNATGFGLAEMAAAVVVPVCAVPVIGTL